MFDDELDEEMPLGLVMSLAKEPDSMRFFTTLSYPEKKQLISYIGASTTKDMAKRRIEEVLDMCRSSDEFFY
jgi:uncharacterized protein YdeI (YjbR/CyaY-like superfamily)